MPSKVQSAPESSGNLQSRDEYITERVDLFLELDRLGIQFDPDSDVSNAGYQLRIAQHYARVAVGVQGSCGCCAVKDPARVDAFGHAYGCVCENHMDVPIGILPGKCQLHVPHLR